MAKCFNYGKEYGRIAMSSSTQEADLVERAAGHFRVVARQLAEQLTPELHRSEVERDAVLLSDALIGAVEPRPCSERD